MSCVRKPYASDVSDIEWALVVPYLVLLREDADQRDHSLREQFNGLRYVIRHGIPWRAMPNDLPSWFSIYQQAQRWLAAGCFEALADDLRAILRLAAGRKAEPTAAILDSRTLRSSCESGTRAGYDGAKCHKGSKLHMAVDTLGHLLALHVTPANADDRGEVEPLAKAIQAATGNSVSLAYVDQGYTGNALRRLPRRMGSSSKSSSCQRPRRGSCFFPSAGSSRDHSPGLYAFVDWQRVASAMASTPADPHLVAFVCIMLNRPFYWHRSITASSTTWAF